MKKIPDRIIHKNLGATVPQWKLEYIREFAATQTARQMAEVVLLSESFIMDYCRLHEIERKLVLSKKNHHHEKLSPAFVAQCMNKVRAILRSQGNDVYLQHNVRNYESRVRKEKQERPPAKYGNKSREEGIDELLKMDMNGTA